MKNKAWLRYILTAGAVLSLMAVIATGAYFIWEKEPETVAIPAATPAPSV